MSWAQAIATVASGLYSSKKADDAANEGSVAANRAAEEIRDSGVRARGDALELFPLAQRDLLAGSSAAYDLYKAGAAEQQGLVTEGNLAAQQTTANGFDQVRAALLGIPQQGAQAFSPTVIGQKPEIQASDFADIMKTLPESQAKVREILESGGSQEDVTQAYLPYAIERAKRASELNPRGVLEGNMPFRVKGQIGDPDPYQQPYQNDWELLGQIYGQNPINFSYTPGGSALRRFSDRERYKSNYLELSRIAANPYIKQGY